MLTNVLLLCVFGLVIIILVTCKVMEILNSPELGQLPCFALTIPPSFPDDDASGSQEKAPADVPTDTPLAASASGVQLSLSGSTSMDRNLTVSLPRELPLQMTPCR